MTVGAVRTPLLLGVEALWGFAAASLFVEAFGQGDGSSPSLVAVAVIVVGPYVVGSALRSWAFGDSSLRLAGLLLSACGLLVVLRMEYGGATPWAMGWLTRFVADPGASVAGNAHVVAGVVVAAPLWVRGLTRGLGGEPRLDDALRSAAVGLAVVAYAALVGPEVRLSPPWGAFVIAYGVMALLALAAFNAVDGRMRVGRFARRSWVGFAALFGAAGAVTLVAAAIDPSAFGALGVLGDVARMIVLGALTALFVVLTPIFMLIGWLLALLLGNNPPEFEPPEMEPISPEEREQGERPGWFDLLLRVLTMTGITGAVIIAALLIWSSIRRIARQRPAVAGEQREDVEPASSLAADLASLVGSLRARIGGRRGAASRYAIRRLYRQMLDAAADAGIERPAAVTPLRFAGRLDAWYASDTPSAITEAFIESRYGERVVEEARVEELAERWRRLSRPRSS